MMNRIKDCDLPLYFYGLYTKYKDDQDYKHYILDHKALCLPLLSDSGEVRGFIAYDLYEPGVIRQPLDFSLKNDNLYKELNEYCMTPKGEDGFLYFDKEKCVNKIIDFYNDIQNSVEAEEPVYGIEENTIDIINNIFGE